MAQIKSSGSFECFDVVSLHQAGIGEGKEGLGVVGAECGTDHSLVVMVLAYQRRVCRLVIVLDLEDIAVPRPHQQTVLLLVLKSGRARR